MAVSKPDFTMQFGSAKADLKPISASNYSQGWDFVGSTPPTKNDFTYLQYLADQRAIWLFENYIPKSMIGIGANQIPDMNSFQSTLNMPGIMRFPGGFKLQWALGNTNSTGAADVAFPATFDTFGLGAVAIERNPYAWGAGISNTWAIQLSTLTKTGVQAICRASNGTTISPVNNAGCIVLAWGK